MFFIEKAGVYAVENVKYWLSDLLEGIGSSEGCIGLLKGCGGSCARRNVLPHMSGFKEELERGTDRAAMAEIISRHTGAECTPIENGFILTYNRGKGCDCALVTGGYVSSPVLCSCTLGFHETLWNTMFERPVAAELLESFLRGGNCCSYKITLLEKG